MKKVFQILLLTLTMLYFNGASMVWGMYYSNQQYFEINCENKDKPALECHGKCQAIKEMQDLNQKQDVFKQAQVFPAVVILSTQPTIVLSPNGLAISTYTFPKDEGNEVGFYMFIIQPPD